jgi:hypothetical protein
MRIISCSRRTDVPAFYTPWLLDRLRAGYCHTFNPFGGQVYRVSLAPEDCLALVFWTRNPAQLLPHLAELDARGYRYYFHFTILGYPAAIDTHNPALTASLDTFRRLSERISPRRVRWRYDPILLSTLTHPEYHLERFAAIARALEGYTEHCTFAFVDFYSKTIHNLQRVSQRTGIQFYRPALEEQQALAGRLAAIAAAHGMSLNSCCDDALLVNGVRKNHCIDPALVRELAPSAEALPAFKPTRTDCGCLASVDIGVYDTCVFGCTYCYATHSRAVALRNRRAHDPADSVLWRPARLRGQDLDARAVPLKG